MDKEYVVILRNDTELKRTSSLPEKIRQSNDSKNVHKGNQSAVQRLLGSTVGVLKRFTALSIHFLVIDERQCYEESQQCGSSRKGHHFG